MKKPLIFGVGAGFVPRATRRHVHVPVAVICDRLVSHGYVLNISQTGVFVRLPHEPDSALSLGPGTRVELRLELPQTIKPLDLKAEVIRLAPETHDVHGGAILSVGFGFVDLEDSTKGRLERYLDSLSSTVLVLDDDPDVRRIVATALEDDYRVIQCERGERALQVLETHDIAVAVVDQRMIGMTGGEFLKEVVARDLCPRMRAIVLSAHSEVDEVKQLLNLGKVFHFMNKPCEIRALLATVHHAVGAYSVEVQTERRRSALEHDNWQLRRENVQLRIGRFLPVAGNDRAMREIIATIEQVAPTDATVLIRGETGTGKELVARAIHGMSERQDKHFVAVNCAALPENLIESELFGHERGAFTGARDRRIGRFEQANGGTIFLDEIGDLPVSVQVKFLRVLQESSFERIGSSTTQDLDIRVIAATHRDLDSMIDSGEFREDLFYRINVVPMYLPPLRERIPDMWPMVKHYLGLFQRQMAKQGIEIDDKTRAALEEHNWPGNIRELVNVVERMVALTPSNSSVDLSQIGLRGNPRASTSASAVPKDLSGKLKDMVSELEARAIAAALKRTTGNKTQASKDLGISRQSLLMKIARYNLG